MHCAAIVLLFCCPSAVLAGKITLSIQESDIRDVMQLLSREQRLNIFVADGVSGQVSINLYEMETTQAIALIAESAGFVVERRDGSFFVIEREDSGKYHQSDRMEVRVFRVQYASATDIETAIQDHLSDYGSVKSLEDGNMVIVQDMPAFIDDIEVIIDAIDREPKQIMIEAKILEISLTDNQSYGLNWAKLFDSSDGSGSIGTQRLASPLSPGLFARYSNSNVELVLSALKERGRLRTISTPKLLAMEGREAESVVGTDIGFRVTTTVNQVTTETIEFLETGIILKVTPSVDRKGRIMLDIHPEVSSGTVSDDGIPSKTTTQVSTRMLVPDGRTVFLGGLIKHSISNSREGVPGLGDIPFIGSLFSNDATNILSTEIVVLITPYIVNFENQVPEDADILRIESIKAALDSELGAKSIEMDEKFGKKTKSNIPQREYGDN
jgi:type II secretory pathway component GspD/PulD (secretin)